MYSKLKASFLTAAWYYSNQKEKAEKYTILFCMKLYTVKAWYLKHAYLKFLDISNLSSCPNLFPFLFTYLKCFVMSKLFSVLNTLCLYRIGSVHLRNNIAAVFGLYVHLPRMHCCSFRLSGYNVNWSLCTC